MKKMLFLLPFLALCLGGCTNISSNNNEGGNNTPAPTTQAMEKHEVSLSTSNYQTYFDISSSTSYNQTTYDFAGCLSYAFYEDVVITIKYYNSTDTSESNSKTEDVKLNAGGNGHFAGGGKYLGTVNAVKGKVIYWM